MTMRRRIETEQQLNIESITYGKLTWVNLESPTAKAMVWLAHNYPFDPLDLEDCLSRIERPKIDEYPDYLFTVLHFPVFSKAARVTTPSQVAIFIGEDYLVTVHSGNLKPLVKLFKDCQANEPARNENMGRSSGYLLYRILDRLVDYCFPILNKIIANIEQTEDRVFSKYAPETVKELSMLRRDIISFRRVIRPQVAVIASLGQKVTPFLKEEREAEFGDVVDHIRRISDELDDRKEVVEGLNDTNNSLTSFRINNVMRVLTILATIMMPLTLLSGIYGMNILLPGGIGGEGNPLSFPIMIAIMLVISGSMLALFRLKRWL